MDYTDSQLAQIPHTISEPRFTTYLKSCSGNRQKAMALYEWNLEASSAFVVPLHVFEVTMRNAIVERLEQVHTSNWPWTKGFVVSLPNHGRYNPRKNLEQVAAKQPTTGKVVAELKFVFWEKLLTKRYNDTLWGDQIKRIFPHTPTHLTPDQIRNHLHESFSIIRKLRNRIAHHEPIFLRNLQTDYQLLHDLILWRDQETADWMNCIQKIKGYLEKRPKQ